MKVIVFDTETIGKVTQDFLNIGYQIIDLNPSTGAFKALIKRDYLTDIFNNKIFCLNDDFVHEEKYNKYVVLLEEKKIIKHSLKKIFKIMSDDIAKYEPLFGYAYNCEFDIDKFAKNAERYGLPNPLEGLTIFDIWGYACEYICKTDEYISWAKKNESFTKTGAYLRTSVESVCQFLYNDLEFSEEHTALSDVNNETNILSECVRRGCDITKPLTKKTFASEKIFSKTIRLPNGDEFTISYKKETTRGNRTIYSL